MIDVDSRIGKLGRLGAESLRLSSGAPMCAICPGSKAANGDWLSLAAEQVSIWYHSLDSGLSNRSGVMMVRGVTPIAKSHLNVRNAHINLCQRIAILKATLA